MLRIIFSCDSGPALYFISKRARPSARTVATMRRATVSDVAPTCEQMGLATAAE